MQASRPDKERSVNEIVVRRKGFICVVAGQLLWIFFFVLILSMGRVSLLLDFSKPKQPMGQQHKKVIKRRRRKAYNNRKKALLKAGGARKAARTGGAAAAKKPAAKKAPAKKAAKAPAKKAVAEVTASVPEASA